MSTRTAAQPGQVITRDESGVSGRTRWLCVSASLAAVAAAAPTLFISGVLNGPSVMNGSARGTALVMLVLAVPTLLLGLTLARRDPVRGRVLVLGALAYLTYNAMLFVYATPFNRLFLLYVALLGLSLWTLVSALLEPLPLVRTRPGLPARSIAAFLLVVVGLNAAGWLAFVVPELGDSTPDFLVGTGLTTNPIYVQDLAIWLPAMSVAAVLLWRRRAVGVLLAGAGLVFWLVEAVGVAVDQWFGHRADPASDVATLGGAVMFLVLAAATAVPLVAWWRNVGAPRPARGPGASPRGEDHE